MSSSQENQWQPMVLRKQMTSKPKSEFATYQAKTKGQVETIARAPAQRAGPSAAAVETAAQAGDFRTAPAPPLEFRLALSKARQAKNNMTQADLAKLLNIPTKSIADFEAGKSVPTGPLIALLNRKLNTVLPRIPKVKKTQSFENDY